MDLIKINENKLKIMLTPSDMQSYAISAEELDAENIETRAAFRTIMKEARSRTGFDSDGNRIYVQLYPSKEGGCELFVTKLGLSGQHDKKERHAIASSKSTPDQSNIAVFVFESLKDVIRVCQHLRTRFLHGESSVWRDELGRYYLRLRNRKGTYPCLNPVTFAFVHEYAEAKEANATLLYITEHASPICEKNAIERLSEL